MLDASRLQVEAGAVHIVLCDRAGAPWPGSDKLTGCARTRGRKAPALGRSFGCLRNRSVMVMGLLSSCCIAA